MSQTIAFQFSETIESRMRDFYQSLREKDRRRYAAMEAMKLPHGGLKYIAGVLGCCENTIAQGIKEISKLAQGDPLQGRQRAEGGGRPKKK